MRIKKLLSFAAATAIAATALAGMAVTASAADTNCAEWNIYSDNSSFSNGVLSGVDKASDITSTPTVNKGDISGNQKTVEDSKNQTFKNVSGKDINTGANGYTFKMEAAKKFTIDSKLSSMSSAFESYDLTVAYYQQSTTESGIKIEYGTASEQNLKKAKEVFSFTVKGITTDNVTITALAKEMDVLYIGIKYNPKSSGGGGGEPSADPTPTPTATPTAAPTATPTTAPTAAPASPKSMKIGDSVNFGSDTAQTFSGEALVANDYVKVYASVGKEINVADSNKTLNGKPYTKVLKFGGTGSINNGTPAYRVIEVLPEESGVLEIVAVTGKTGNQRALAVTQNEQTQTKSVNELGVYTYDVVANAPVYIYSTNSGINIYGISLARYEYFSFSGAGSFEKIVVTSSEHPGETAEISLGKVTLEGDDASFYLLITGIPEGVTVKTTLQ